MSSALLPPQGLVLDLLCVVVWEPPKQGRCSLTLGAKLLTDEGPQTPYRQTLCGKRDLSGGDSQPFPFPIGPAHQGPAPTIPGGDRKPAPCPLPLFTQAG